MGDPISQRLFRFDLAELQNHPPEEPCPRDRDSHLLYWIHGAGGVLVGVDGGGPLVVAV